MQLGKLAIWCTLDGLSSADAAAFVQQAEAWGYDAIWQPEAVGRNVLVQSGWLLANTQEIKIATGIANIYARDAVSMRQAQLGLAEQSGGRFLLGMGVSHSIMVEGMRGHDYEKPVAKMRAYLEAMKKAPYMAPPPAEAPPTVIAALGPRMLELAAEMADGAHPYNVTPEHTRTARSILGPDKLLCVEQKVILETDPAVARTAARREINLYLSLVNYQNSWKREGFDEADWSNGGSDRLIDALFAWGDEAAIRDRIRQHMDAGATQVCIQPVDPTGESRVARKVLAALAPKG